MLAGSPPLLPRKSPPTSITWASSADGLLALFSSAPDGGHRDPHRPGGLAPALFLIAAKNSRWGHYPPNQQLLAQPDLGAAVDAAGGQRRRDQARHQALISARWSRSWLQPGAGSHWVTVLLVSGIAQGLGRQAPEPLDEVRLSARPPAEQRAQA